MKKHIRFDWAIKRLLRQKANFVILEGFLSELLGEDVFITEILEGEANLERPDGKFNKVDILVKNSKNDLMLIEVQNERENDFFHRMNFGQAKLIAEHIDEGDNYGKIKKIYSINIVYFDLGQGKDYVYVGSTNFVGMHTKDVLQLNASQKKAYPIEKVSDIFTTYYLLKVNKFDDFAEDTLDEWIYFLKNNEIKDDFKAKGLKEAKEKLRVDNLPEEDKINYQKYLESKRIESNVYETALAEGRSLADAEIQEAKKREEKAQEDKEKAEAKELETLSITVKVLNNNGLTPNQISEQLQRPISLINKILKIE